MKHIKFEVKRILHSVGASVRMVSGRSERRSVNEDSFLQTLANRALAVNSSRQCRDVESANPRLLRKNREAKKLRRSPQQIELDLQDTSNGELTDDNLAIFHDRLKERQSESSSPTIWVEISSRDIWSRNSSADIYAHLIRILPTVEI